MADTVAGVVEGKGDIDAEGDDGDVGSDADACIKGYAFEYLGGLECGSGADAPVFVHPYVAEVGEYRAFEDADEGESLFDVANELYVANAHGNIGAADGVLSVAQMAQSPSAHGGGTATDECLFVGHEYAVSVRNAEADKGAQNECGAVAPIDVAFEFAVEAEVLAVLHVVVGGMLLTTYETVDSIEEVACRLDGETQVVEVVAGAYVLVRVCVFVVGVEQHVVVF